MAVAYRVYRNDGRGGAVDLSAPVWDGPGLAADLAPLDDGSDTTYLVRAYDPATGYEETNGDARVRVVVDPDGADATDRPPPPAGVTAAARAGGAVAVAWHYPPAPAVTPAAFRVYAWPDGSPPDYAAARAAVAYHGGDSPARPYRATLTGLTPGTAYRVAVRAAAAAGEEQNTRTALVRVPGAGPAAVAGLAAAAVP